MAVKILTLNGVEIDAAKATSGDLDAANNKIINVANPSNPQDVATKDYVDSSAASGALDGTFRIKNTVDDTKQIAFNAANISTATTRTITMPDANVDLGLVNTALQRDGSVASIANQSLGGFRITNLASPVNASDAATKGYVDSALAGLDFQPDVDAAVADASITAPGSGLPAAAAGQRYILESGTGSLAGAWGSIAGVDDNDIVEFDGTDWFVAYDVSAQGPGALVWDRDLSVFTRWDGSTWEEFGGLAGVTAGAGLTKSGNTVSIELDTDSGLEFDVPGDSGKLRVDAYQGLERLTQGLAVKLEASSPTLRRDLGTGSDELGVKFSATASGFEADSSGLKIKLESANPSLEITASSELKAKLDAAGAIVSGAGGLAVQLEASNPSLEIASNRLGVKLNPAGAIVSGASGVAVNLGTASSSKGLEISANELSVKIGSAATSAGLEFDGTDGRLKVKLGAGLQFNVTTGAIDSVFGGAAADVTIADAGNYYTATDVEGALQEVGSDIVQLQTDLGTAETDILALQADIGKSYDLGVAGESMAASQIWIVRRAKDGETAGRYYKALANSAASIDANAVGVIIAGATGISAGDPVKVYKLGAMTLGSSDSVFAAVDISKPVYLSQATAGKFTLTPTSASGDVLKPVGFVAETGILELQFGMKIIA
jgi:hypothetical protein